MSDQFHPDLFCQVHDRLPYPCPWCRIEQLERWKREATEVLNGWDAVVAEVPMGDVDLGRTKAQAVAAYIKRLEAATP